MLTRKSRKGEKSRLRFSLRAVVWTVAVSSVVLAVFGQSVREIRIANKLTGGGKYEMDYRWRVVKITLHRRGENEVGSLNSLSSLHSVRLEQCDLGDASVLEKISCNELVVDDCRINSNGEVILKFHGRRLVLDLKFFSRIGELSQCINLNSLSIWNPKTTRPVDLAKVSRLQASHLKSLAVHGCRPLNIDELKHQETLKELTLYGCEVRDSSFVSQLRSISSLSLIGSKPDSLTGFETATNLRTFTHDGLSFSEAEIAKIESWIPDCKIDP